MVRGIQVARSAHIALLGLLSSSAFFVRPALGKTPECGATQGDRAAVATVLAAADAMCPCESATSPKGYVKCVRGVASVSVTGGTLPAQCKRAVIQAAQRSTCAGTEGAVTCCQVTAKGKQRCAVKRSAEKCRPPRGGSAAVGTTDSCYDACLPLLGNTLVSDTEMQEVVAIALDGLADPWGDDFALALLRSAAELGVRLEFATDATAPDLRAQPAAARDCFNTYCPDASYCGGPSNTVTQPCYLPGVLPQGCGYLRAGGCLNGACFQHDIASFQRCVSSNPPCYFSPQSRLDGVDAALFSACDSCPGLDGPMWDNDRLICGIARGVLAKRNHHPDCNCSACSTSVDGECHVSGVCNPATGTCEGGLALTPTRTPVPTPTPTATAPPTATHTPTRTTIPTCQTDLDCNPTATGEYDFLGYPLDPDADCVWRRCLPGSPGTDSRGCVAGGVEGYGSGCSRGLACSVNDQCINQFSGVFCAGEDVVCRFMVDPDPDCYAKACSGGADADANGCGGYTLDPEPVGSPCFDGVYGLPGTCQPHPFYGIACDAFSG